MVEFGEQLRRAREEKGMTQQSLAELYRTYDMALFYKKDVLYVAKMLQLITFCVRSNYI